MSYNGSGTFQINTSGQPVVTGTIISSTAFNSLTADLATGLSTAITKDGQTTTTARIIFAQGTRDNTLTASSAVATDASKNLVSVTNTGTGNNVLATSPTLVTPILGTPTSGNLINCTGINYDGYKNRLINGQMQIAQRGTSVAAGTTVPTTAPTYPSLDRWYAYSIGGATGTLVAQVAGTGANKNNLQVTGLASVTAVGVGQRIEQLNCYDLAGSTCTLSVNMSNSLLTTVTWTASYATTANTWSAKTQIATGTFTVSGTLANYSAQISVPAAATTGIEILFTVGAQTSGTWVIGEAQFEKSSTVATSFDYRPYTTELQLCQRYYYRQQAVGTGDFFGAGLCTATTTVVAISSFPTTMRTSPTALEQSGTAANYATYTGAGTTTACSAVPQFVVASVWSGTSIFTVASGLTAGQAGILRSNNAAAYLGWSAEL